MAGVREVTLPYRALYGDPTRRPYLRLWLEGINGADGSVWGVVDSGADNTSLPLGFASLMGYDVHSLARREGMGAGGSIDTWIAREPSRASIPSWEELGFEIYPTFIDGSQMPLWGRTDLFMAFHVTFSEPSKEFTLTAVEPA